MSTIEEGRAVARAVREDTMSRSFSTGSYTLSSPMFVIGYEISPLVHEWSSNNNMKKIDRG
jgi:hypothetical protein